MVVQMETGPVQDQNYKRVVSLVFGHSVVLLQILYFLIIFHVYYFYLNALNQKNYCADFLKN